MEQQQIVPAIIVVAILVLLYIGMAAGWRARKRRQAAFTPAPTTPADPGELLLEVPMLYVATTPANKPLERLAIPGLGFRARGSLIVWQTGVTLSLDGEPDVFVPLSAIRSIGTSTFTIDRVVENGGLLRLDWTTPLSGDAASRLKAQLAGATRKEKKTIVAASAAATATPATSADVESYLRILDATDSLRALSTVQSLIPRQEGSIA